MDQLTKIIHVDMDYFYAQVEMRDNPNLKNKPLIISGGPNERSVICTASYEAREYGIYAGMSSSYAFKKIPNLLYVRPNFEKYYAVSRQMHDIFKRYSDIIEPLSLDEAYIDVTNNKINSKSAIKVASLIQRDIKNELDLTCSIGVSYNKFLAKVGSDYNKPYGMTVITPNDSIEFIENLKIKNFPGVGKRSIDKYYSHNIYTGKDLKEYSEEDLIKLFGKIGTSLYYKARGIDHSKVIVLRDRKSYGKEKTYPEDLVNKEDIKRHLKRYCDQIYKMVEEDHKIGYTVSLKIRYANFDTINRSHTIKNGITSIELLYSEVEKLFNKNYSGKPVRLSGVTISNIKDKTREVYYEQVLLDLYNNNGK